MIECLKLIVFVIFVSIPIIVAQERGRQLGSDFAFNLSAAEIDRLIWDKENSTWRYNQRENTRSF